MKRRDLLVLSAMVLPALVGCSSAPTASDEGFAKELPPGAIRVATFNTSMHRTKEGELIADLKTGSDEQARATAEIIQRVRPDILLLEEFDYDEEGTAARLFQDGYLSVKQHDQSSIEYGYRYVVPTNTGLDSGFDLDNDGELHGPGDAYGFADYPGQFGFVIFSRYPMMRDEMRTFQTFLYKDMPGAVFPEGDDGPWYDDDELAVLRLSSKNHVDLPIDVAGTRVHLLAHHPTPPAFDGPEDRNGLRNEAEIRFWRDYVSGADGSYIYDDRGDTGGLAESERFVIVGDHNADPNDGSGRPGAMEQLLSLDRINTSMTPSSKGGVVASEEQGGKNASHVGDPANDTGDFGDSYLGNLRLDYVLPSADLDMLDAQVFWPTPDSEQAPLVTHSDHRLVWVDLQVY
jgi:3-phytase